MILQIFDNMRYNIIQHKVIYFISKILKLFLVYQFLPISHIIQHELSVYLLFLRHRMSYITIY